MMDLPDLYQAGVIAISMFIVVIWAVDVWKGVEAVRRWHDERSSRNLLLSVVLFVAAVGLTVSAGGFIFEGPFFAVLGLGLARGALLVGGIVLLVTGYRK